MLPFHLLIVIYQDGLGIEAMTFQSSPLLAILQYCPKWLIGVWFEPPVILQVCMRPIEFVNFLFLFFFTMCP